MSRQPRISSNSFNAHEYVNLYNEFPLWVESDGCKFVFRYLSIHVLFACPVKSFMLFTDESYYSARSFPAWHRIYSKSANTRLVCCRCFSCRSFFLPDLCYRAGTSVRIEDNARIILPLVSSSLSLAYDKQGKAMDVTMRRDGTSCLFKCFPWCSLISVAFSSHVETLIFTSQHLYLGSL